MGDNKTPVNDLPHMNFRSYIGSLRNDNDLVEIDTEVDPYLEVGAIIRKVCETDGKAPLFKNPKGKRGHLFQILGAPNSLRSDSTQRYGRLARHLGLLPTCDASWTNWSIARGMNTGPDQLGVLIAKPQHIWQIQQQWKAEGKDMPWALAMGVPPAATMAAGMPLPDGCSEGEYVGAMTGHAIDVVKCETNELLVPANSEIVFEGTISSDAEDCVLEGPFGEMHGYVYPGERHKSPSVRIDTITFRDNAILPVSCPGRLTDETQTMVGPLAAAEIRQRCQDHGYPVVEAMTPFESQVTWVALQIDTVRLRQMKTTAAKLCKSFGELIFHHKCGLTIHRVVLVGDDIDVYNFQDVMWAFCTRCCPIKDEYLFDDCQAFLLIPYMAHGNWNPLKGGKVISNALLASEYMDGPDWETGDFEHGYPDNVKDRVIARWDEMGLHT
ncbi:UbiD-domain-containing protein [Aspergillus steynii IBT 23096]|uniref:Ferulic acid decarboxylase 1 n=1 Tax=Aspergillus steynii IBT 23096 TaxID=1392250 RepID=A0A2I2G422_9EURO|nr:UbiD-domain-containing protein [Aspergillus steynii IBT 23096]PLB47627.1 UbiD-domain-containing protein [Aspergillus steynii IBT 23096]